MATEQAYHKVGSDTTFLPQPSSGATAGYGLTYTSGSGATIAVAWTQLALQSALASEISRATGAETTLTSNLATTNTNLSNAINLLPVNSFTASHTLALTDQGCQVEMNASSAVVLTIPTFASVALPTRTIIPWICAGAGQITFTPASGVTLNTASSLTSRAQWAQGTLICRATNQWVLSGDLT